MIRVFLIGYMGAGKTTLGKAFARALGLTFVDLDWYLEERFHKTVRQLFTERGEEGFRELERRMLHEAAEFEDVVISVGGGTPCFFDNMEYMNEVGETFFLDVDIQVLFRRLKVAKQQQTKPSCAPNSLPAFRHIRCRIPDSASIMPMVMAKAFTAGISP